MGGAVPLAGKKPGFKSGVATGAAATGASVLGLFQLLPIGKLILNTGSYIGMLDGVAVVALVCFCSLLLYGQVRDYLTAAKLSTLNIIVGILALVITIDVLVLGYRASLSTDKIVQDAPQISELFKNYEKHVKGFTFSPNPTEQPDLALRLEPAVNFSQFKDPNGQADFTVNDVKKPVVFEMDNLEQLEGAYGLLLGRYHNLTDIRADARSKCENAFKTNDTTISLRENKNSDCGKALRTLLGGLS